MIKDCLIELSFTPVSCVAHVRMGQLSSFSLVTLVSPLPSNLKPKAHPSFMLFMQLHLYISNKYVECDNMPGTTNRVEDFQSCAILGNLSLIKLI